MKKRIISLVMSALMLTSSMPLMSVAASDASAISGQSMTVGDKYELTQIGELSGAYGRGIESVDTSGYLNYAGTYDSGAAGVTLTVDGLAASTQYSVVCNIKLSAAANAESSRVRYNNWSPNAWKFGTIYASGGLFDFGTITTSAAGDLSISIIGDMSWSACFEMYSMTVTKVSGGDTRVYDFSTAEKTPAISERMVVGLYTVVRNPAHFAVGAAAVGTSDTAVYYAPAEAADCLEEGVYKVSGLLRAAKDSNVTVSVLEEDGTLINGSESSLALTAGEWSELEQYVVVTEPTVFGRISVDGGSGAFDIAGLTFEYVSKFDGTEVLHNLITDGECNTGIPAGLTDSGNYTLKWDGHGYVVASARTEGSVPVVYTPVYGDVDPEHTYLLSFRARVSADDDYTVVRFATYNNSFVYPMVDEYTASSSYSVRLTDEWQTFTFKISPDTNAHMLRNKQIRLQIHGSGGGNSEYLLDGFTLIDVTAVIGTGYTNLITDGDCTNGIPEGMSDSIAPLVHHEDGYVITPDRNQNGVSPFLYTTNVEGGLDPTHTYRLSLLLRSGEPYASSNFRFYTNKNAAVTPVGSSSNIISLTSEWKTYTFEVSPTANPGLIVNGQICLSIRGYMGNPGIFHIDNLSLVDLTPDLPEEAKDNLINNGNFNEGSEEEVLAKWSDELSGKRVTAQYSGEDRMIALAGRDVSDKAVKFDTDVKLEKGRIYRLKFKMRTQDLIGEDTVRLYAATDDGTLVSVVPLFNVNLDESVWNNVDLNGEWRTVVININETENTAFYDMTAFNLHFLGSVDKPGFGGLFLDDMSLTDITPDFYGMPHLGILMVLLKMKSNDLAGTDQEPEEVPDAGESIVYTNLIEDADSAAGISKWSTNGQKLEAKTEGDTEYVAASDITVNYVGFTYKSGVTLQPGEYKFSCKIRTSVEGETSQVRAYNPIDNTATFVGIDNSWKELTFDMTVTTPIEFNLKICGGMQADLIQNYDISEITLIDKAGTVVSGGQNPTDNAGGNLLEGAASQSALSKWSTNGQKLEAKIEGDTEYLAASGITVNYVGFTYKSGVTLQPGEYKFSCKVRTSVKGDTTSLRVVNGIDNTQNFATVVGDWSEITFNFNVSSASEFSFKICGGMQAECIQPYDISDINLTKVG